MHDEAGIRDPHVCFLSVRGGECNREACLRLSDFLNCRLRTTQSELDCLKHSSTRRSIKQTLLHGLFPVVRAEVLRLLFTNPRQELYTRELARLSFLALRTVQDELAKLESANLIASRSNGYQRFYRANPTHPLYRAIVEIVCKGAVQAKPDPPRLPSRRGKRVKRPRA